MPVLSFETNLRPWKTEWICLGEECPGSTCSSSTISEAASTSQLLFLGMSSLEAPLMRALFKGALHVLKASSD